MFRPISVPDHIRKVIVLPYTKALSYELYNLFIPDDIILVLWYPKNDTLRIPPPFIHSLSTQLSIPYCKLQPIFNNVYLFNFEFYELDAFGLLLGFLSPFNIPIYCELPNDYTHLFIDLHDVFNINLIQNSLYYCIYNDVTLNSFYLIFKDYLKVPKSIKDMSEYNSISVSHFLSRLLQSNSLVIDNKYNFTLRSNNYSDFIKASSHVTSSVIPASQYPNSLKSLDKFHVLNFNASSFPFIVSQSSDPQFPNIEIKFGKHIFKSSISSLDLEQTAIIANAYIFYLMNHCWQKFKYFQGMSCYYNGKLHLDNDQLLFNKCRKLIATHDTYFDPCKYIAFATNFIKKHSDDDMVFTFYTSVERINYYTATLSVVNLNYTDVSCDYSSKDECKQQLSKVFCCKYGVIKSLFINNQTMIFKQDLGKIAHEELEDWIDQLPVATLFVTQKKDKRKLKSHELLIKLKKQKLEEPIKSVESVWNVKGITIGNAWNSGKAHKGVLESTWGTGKASTSLDVEKEKEAKKENKAPTAVECQPMKDKSLKMAMNKKKTSTWNQKIDKRATPALKFGLGFQKKKREIKKESFSMNGLSSIEVELLFKMHMVTYPHSYMCDYKYLKGFANVAWGKVTETEKKVYWKYLVAMKMYKSK